ncbi:alcohol dehydrogenase catalytic domain-containing protein [Nakamurella sp.]|uniref:alcohol dehydrogenase catalytic domain-containing protein n=1 Tax=Nakamurella sp. TaxID=1869182 RepID=UPI00378311EE
MAADDSVPEMVDTHWVLAAPGIVERVCRPRPALPPGWVRVRVAYCGVCGSDRSYYSGSRSTRLPKSLGHEWVGVVEALGSRVGSLAPGDVVTTDLNFRCGTCSACVSGHSHLCEHGQVGLFSNRGFAERLDIDAGYLTTCSSRTPAPHLALAEPLSCAMHAVAHVRPRDRDRVLLVGAGGLGLCVAFLLRHRWALPFDVVDADQVRLDRLGRAVTPVGRAITAPAGHYDVVIDASGTVGGLRAACESAGPGARLSTMSHLPDGTDAGFLLAIRTDITVSFSYLNGERANLGASVELLEQHWTPEWDALLDIRPLADLSAVLECGAAPGSAKVIIDVGGTGADERESGLQG